MSLDLSTLKVGDTVRPLRWETTPATVQWVDEANALLRRPGFRPFLIGAGIKSSDHWYDLDNWEVVVPPLPCPITEPVTLRCYPGPTWASYRVSPAALEHIGPITLHPPGTPISQIDGEFGFYTWGET